MMPQTGLPSSNMMGQGLFFYRDCDNIQSKSICANLKGPPQSRGGKAMQSKPFIKTKAAGTLMLVAIALQIATAIVFPLAWVCRWSIPAWLPI